MKVSYKILKVSRLNVELEVKIGLIANAGFSQKHVLINVFEAGTQ